MIRPTADQIDRAILDAAARTFALHGFAKTSVQQLADGVGYSKAGLLNRFASKHILYSAAVEAAVQEVGAVLLAAAPVPAGPAAVAVVLGSLTERALDRPGLVALMAQAARPTSEEPGRERLYAATDELISRLCDGCADEDGTLRLRAVLALDLIVAAVGTQDHALLRVDRARLQPLVAALAQGVLNPPRQTSP